MVVFEGDYDELEACVHLLVVLWSAVSTVDIPAPHTRLSQRDR